MQTRTVHDPFNNTDITLKLNDIIFRMLEETELHVNDRGYVMILWEERMRPLHAWIYYVLKGEWSVQYKTCIHHKDEDKHNNVLANLELLPWEDHRKLHGTNNYTNPKGLRIA